jgi:hypothetical protein
MRPFPRAPWGNFPLSELLVLLAVGCGVAGFVEWGTTRGAWLVVAATVLGCLAGAELCLREHLSGRRSRSGVLATAAAAAASCLGVYLRLPALVIVLVTVAAFGAALVWLDWIFARRTARPPEA